jgi:photosystem II stability/assembly factor-like uncharacterized protein
MRFRHVAVFALALVLIPGLLLLAGLPGQPGHARPEAEVQEEKSELGLPVDSTLVRALQGSDKGLTPADVLPAARSRTAQISQATKERAPGIAAAPWKLEGPTNIGGRLLDVVVDPDAKDTIFVAAASGGVFKSSDAGKTFSSVWPTDEIQPIGALAISKSGVLYAGTGETGPGGGSMTYGGGGMFRSTDKGKTWKRIGLEKTSRIARVVVDPHNDKRIWVAASGNLFKPTQDRGLYRSDDGGDTWKKVLAGDNDTTGASDIAVDPKDPKRVFATTWDHQRTPDRRRYEGLGSGLYRSTDGGETWSRTGTPAFGPNPALGRPSVAISNQDSNLVYATAAGVSGTSAGFYVSTDGGSTFTPRHSPDLITGGFTYAWWFGRIFVDPNNDKHVFVPGVSLGVTDDGGNTWGTSNGPHSDHHGMAWDPKVKDRVYLANDGGSYRSDDNGVSWEFAEYQPFSQLYGLDVSVNEPEKVVGGLQDNGVNKSWSENGTGPASWVSYGGGDGERTRIKPPEATTLYGCSQYGACFVNKGSGNTDLNYVSTRHNWFTPIEFAPDDPNTVYIGGEILNRSTDDGETFTPISPDLTNGPGKETNPLFKDYGTITTIAAGPKGSGTIYVGTDDGNLQYTHDDGLTWTKAATPKNETGASPWVTRVEIDPRDPNVVYATFSGFRQGDDTTYIQGSRDGGKTFENLSGDLPQAPLNDVNVIGDDLVVAGDMGIFLSRDRGKTWLRLGKDLPATPMHELHLHAPSKRLYVATFGRSIWSIDYTDIDKAIVKPGNPVTTPKAKGTKLGLPSRRSSSCAPLKFKLRAPKGTKAKTATLYVGKKKVKTVKGKALRKAITVKLGTKKSVVKLVLRTTKGLQYTQTVTYKACKKKTKKKR